jgi:hypothetical protein
MSRKHILATLAGATLLLLNASCNNSNTEKTTGNAETANVILPGISIVPVGNSPEFNDAQLILKNTTSNKRDKDSTDVVFNFDVKNYELKMQTPDTGSKLCNNSAQGQHIHFILDNQPYKALYVPTNKIAVANNTEHYLMAFLSRSYHESIKTKGAAIVFHFRVDANGKLQKMETPTTPMVFYSRPKGDYMGKDTTNVLLDFYVWNGTLAADGHKVTAKISNENTPARDTTFTITDWKPYFINHLMTGKCHVTLTLTDKDGKPVDGPNTTVTRHFQLAAQEPLK